MDHNWCVDTILLTLLFLFSAAGWNSSHYYIDILGGVIMFNIFIL